MQDFSVTIKPRFYETDALGHINNASIAAWFEVARVEFLQTLGSDDPDAAKHWMLASLQMDFLAETVYGEDVVARIVDAEIGNSSLKVSCEMSQGERLTVKGAAVLVHFDPQTKTAKRVPDTIRSELASR